MRISWREDLGKVWFWVDFWVMFLGFGLVLGHVSPEKL